MTVDLVATYLRVPVDTVEAWCDDGGIPHIKLGRMLRFDVDELQAGCMTARSSRPASEPFGQDHLVRPAPLLGVGGGWKTLVGLRVLRGSSGLLNP